jgi:energy-converting hydrogenase Eha subunit C
VTVLQAIALTLVALGGWAVVVTRDPVRQAIMLSLYGLVLAVLFFVFPTSPFRRLSWARSSCR